MSSTQRLDIIQHIPSSERAQSSHPISPGPSSNVVPSVAHQNLHETSKDRWFEVSPVSTKWEDSGKGHYLSNLIQQPAHSMVIQEGSRAATREHSTAVIDKCLITDYSMCEDRISRDYRRPKKIWEEKELIAGLENIQFILHQHLQ